MDFAGKESTNTIVQYNVDVDENGLAQGTGSWGNAPVQLPPHLARRLAKQQARHAKKGTPQEREAAVEARRQQVLAEKRNKAREHIDRIEGYIKNRPSSKEADVTEDEGKTSQECKK